MKNYLFGLCLISPFAYSVPPIDYSINAKSPYQSAMEGWENGARMAQQAQYAKQQKELHQARLAQTKREEEYRGELKNLYNKGSLNDDSFQKLLILYPEFTDTTLKLKESLGTLKRE
ncbi:hypothetical protein [Acinetobacter venetianus]|uniref:hypothetical protein n=1 Tax=Acinetobacter venetianus TaxID=52133 RepID=UPI0021503DA1|nr:hypothetical protein [Acinetobacter venetianus]MCR4530040.1 hypothetical protein [Acinetobacter venetianus]